LVRELELIKPLVAVGVGANAMRTLRKWCVPRLENPPELFQITHYSMRGNPTSVWEQEFKELRMLLSRFKPRSE
jgi:hypothetical protein